MKQFAVIGLGRFGTSMVKSLISLGHEVLAVDVKEQRVKNVIDIATHAVQADATDEETLKELGIRNFDVVIISIGQDIQASILATLLVKESGVDYVVAKALSELHGKVLERIGADRVVYPEREMAVRVAHNLESKNVVDYIELSAEHSIVEVTALPQLVDKTLMDLDLRAKYGISILAIKKEDGEILVNPGGDTVVEENDILVAMGTNEELRHVEQ